jgi:hypothetical protein
MILKRAEMHRSNVMLKLKLHSTIELALYAVRNKNSARATAFLWAARSSKWKRAGARCPSGAQLRIVSASVRWNLSENSHQQGEENLNRLNQQASDVILLRRVSDKEVEISHDAA